MSPTDMSLSFAAPAFLWALLALPAALAAYVFAQRRRARYAIRFTNLELLASVMPRIPAWRRHLPAAFSLLALATLVAGFAQPHALIPVPRDQATVVMVMDTSGSMAATDVQPSRMGAARRAGKTFLDAIPANFKISVVAFASTTRILVQPSTDRAAARAALDSLESEGGTAMGDGIMRGVEIAQAALAAPATPTVPATAPPNGGAAGTVPANKPAAILLLSDGANTDGRASPVEAARAAQAAGIPIYTIALGTEDGVLEVPAVPSLPGIGAPGGRRVPTRRIEVPPDERTLRQVAEITGGQFFSAPTANDLRAVYRDIGSRIGFEYERQEVTFAFTGAGALLLAAGALSAAWLRRLT